MPVAVAASARNLCDAGKPKCARNRLKCLPKAYERGQTKGLAPDSLKVQKCMDEFHGGGDPAKGCFALLDATFGAGCSTTGNTAAIVRCSPPIKTLAPKEIGS